jgi:lysophospholipase L1-like esterase
MMCDPRSYQASTYSRDGFHPGDVGYAWMAAEVVSAATTSYKAPQSTCPQMSLIP